MIGCQTELHNSREAALPGRKHPERWQGDPCRDYALPTKSDALVAASVTGELCREGGGHTRPFGGKPSRIVSGGVVNFPAPAGGAHQAFTSRQTREPPMMIARPMFLPRADSVHAFSPNSLSDSRKAKRAPANPASPLTAVPPAAEDGAVMSKPSRDTIRKRITTRRRNAAKRERWAAEGASGASIVRGVAGRCENPPRDRWLWRRRGGSAQNPVV